jgi:prepilin-type N-terminal cleavage/methylation domain-containing protein
LTPRARIAERGDAGFTLVELILVVLVATVALYPIASMFANATADSVEPELVTQAVFLAQARLEAALADYHAAGYAAVAAYPDETGIAGFPGFVVTVSVSPDSTYDGVAFKHVRATALHAAIPPVSLDTWVTQ